MEQGIAERVAEDLAGALEAIHRRLRPRFSRAEPRRRARAYLRGLLGEVERKNGWQLAEHAGAATPYGMQRLLAGAGWDAEAVRDDLRAFVVERLGDADGVLIVDETGFLKKGVRSAGVARQYSGTAGRRENQQIGVFLAYAAPGGCAFLDRALYLPEEWAADAGRRAGAGVPDDVAFATKPELARQLLARAFAAGVPAAWVVGDTVYGGDELRRWLEGQGRRYALAVPCTHGIWTAGEQVEAQALAEALPADAWARVSAGDGAQGPRWYDWACLALPYEASDGWAHWLLVRRSVSRPEERAYYRAGPDRPTRSRFRPSAKNSARLATGGSCDGRFPGASAELSAVGRNGPRRGGHEGRFGLGADARAQGALEVSRERFPVAHPSAVATTWHPGAPTHPRRDGPPCWKGR